MKSVLITSFVLILLIAVLRPILRGKIDPRVQYALWLIAALRLLVPVNLVTSAYSALALADRAEEKTHLAQSIGRTSVPIVPVQSYEDAFGQVMLEWERNGMSVVSIDVDEMARVELRAQELLERGSTVNQLIADYAKPVWLGGAALMGLWFLLVNLRLRRKLRRALPVKAGCPLPVYVTPELPSPCLCGVLRPAVYVTPAALADPDRLRHVLAHELTHYRHRDHWWTWVRCLCLCLYWFDPLVWWAAALSRQDCELACDEGAIRRLGEEERIPYGRTLVAMIAAGRNPLLQTATTMTGTKRRVRERVRLIARKPKTVIAAALATVVIVGCAVGCTFTGAPEDSSTLSPDPEPASSPSIGTEDVLLQNLGFFYDDYSGVVIEGLEGSHAEWHADTSPAKGWLYFTNPGFCCPALAGRKAEGSALWADESRTTLGAVMNVNDERVVSGTVTGFYIHFTVELETGTVLTQDFASEVEGEALELDDQEMVGMARTLAKLLTAAEDYYLNLPEVIENTREDAKPTQEQQVVQEAMDVLRSSPYGTIQLTTGTQGSLLIPINPNQDPNAVCLENLAARFDWEEFDWGTTEEPRFPDPPKDSASLYLINISRMLDDPYPDNRAWLQAWDMGMVQVHDDVNGTNWYYAHNASEDDEFTPYEYLRFWFDTLEISTLRPDPIPDEGQSHEDIARTWAETWEGAMTKVAPGSTYACTYVRVEDLKADCHAGMEQDVLDELGRYMGFSGDDYGKTWFTFSYSTVFVPEEITTTIWAGNTWYYEGDDAPEGALIYSRVAYMVLTDDGWTCEGTGTGW